MSKPVVYELNVGGKKQIGSTGRFEKRMAEHLNALSRGEHCNKRLQNAYNKYRSFTYKVLSYHSTREEAYLEEQRLLDIYYGSDDYLMLNPKATIPPILLGDRNPSKNKEVVEKIVRTKRLRGLFDKSPEVRYKISQANKGRVQTEEEKKKRKQVLDEIKQTEEYKTKHKEGCLKAQRSKSEEAKNRSTKLFRDNNPSNKVQLCKNCGRDIEGASAFSRFHGNNCKLKRNKQQ